MGAGSSFLDLPEGQREEIFQEMKELYENEYLPQVESGQLREGEGYSIFREKLEKFLDSKSLNKDVFFKDDASVFHNSPFALGDVVKAGEGGLQFEGVVVNFDDGLVEVDFGDAIESYAPDKCSLVLSGIEFELGDKVEYTPPNMALHFCGTIVAINADTMTADVLMDGDDPDDIERDVEFEQMRKVKTGRDLSAKFKKGIKLIQAVNRMSGMFGGKSGSKKMSFEEKMASFKEEKEAEEKRGEEKS